MWKLINQFKYLPPQSSISLILMIINTFGNAQNVDIKTVFQALTSMNLKKTIGNKMNKDNFDILYQREMSKHG